MGMRLIQRPWTQQPQEAATPASGAPFPTPFLLFNAAQQRELISGRVPSVQNTVLTPAGYAYNTAGGVTGWTASDMGQPAGVDELCMVTWGWNTTPFNVTSETRLAAFGYQPTGLMIWPYNAGALRADVYHFPDYNGNISANGPILSANAPHAIGMRYIRNSALQLWVDGVVAATVAAPNKAAGLRPTSARFDLSVGTQERAFQQAGAAVWLQDIGEAGMAALTRHPYAPWQLFEPRRIWVPVAAGGGAAADLATTGNSGTFSGTANSPATATLAATGASGALSASAGTSASAALAATGDSGTLSASAYTPALASLAATGGSGIFVGSAFSEATAALSATGGSGTLSASAGAEASASLAATGGSGTLAADAFVLAVATLAATGVSGSLIASAWTTISATLSATGGSGELTASAGEPVVATRVLSSYRPLPPPADPKDVGRWAMNELLTIARHLADGRDFDLLNTIHAQPSKPREGMVVHADGTNWDPGSGAGRYERVGGAWVKL